MRQQSLDYGGGRAHRCLSGGYFCASERKLSKITLARVKGLISIRILVLWEECIIICVFVLSMCVLSYWVLCMGLLCFLCFCHFSLLVFVVGCIRSCGGKGGYDFDGDTTEQ